MLHNHNHITVIYCQDVCYFTNLSPTKCSKHSIIHPLQHHYTGPKIPALYGAPLILGQTHHPVVVFSHGMGCNRCLYSSISSDLASHGYIVAALEHRDQSACTSLRRVPGASVPEGQFDKYIDDWIPFLKIGENDKAFSIRNRQVGFVIIIY